MKLIHNEKGIALPLALMVMFVLTLLGTALWQYSMADTIQVARAESQTKAFYIARSGAEATATWMENLSNNGNSLIGKTAPSNTFGDGTFSVDVKDAPSNRVIIESTAAVNGVPAKAALVLKRIPAFENLSEPLFDNAVFGTTSVILSGTVDVDGTVESGGTLTLNGTVSTQGTAEDTGNTYPDPIFPSDDPDDDNYLAPASPYDLNIGNGSPTNIYEYRYGNILSKSTLTFTPPPGGTMKVRVNKLETQNTDIIVPPGTGTVHLFVDSLLNLKGSVLCSPEQMIIFLAPGSTATLPKGDAVFNAFVYGPSAHVDFSGGQNYNGAILAGTAYASGGIEINYDGLTSIITPGDLGDVFATGFEIDYWLAP